jgi:hypothetical protein
LRTSPPILQTPSLIHGMAIDLHIADSPEEEGSVLSGSC